MKTLVCFLVVSLFLVLRFHSSGGFNFPSILDDARQAMMKFSSKKSSKPSIPFFSSKIRPLFSVLYSSGRRRRAVSRRYRRAVSRRRRYRPVHKTSSSKPSNSFLEVLSKVEKFVLETQASGNRYLLRRATMDSLTRNIKLALNQRSYLFARETLGKALYKTLASRPGGRVKRSTSTARKYLEKLKKEIGADKFSELLGVEDNKTLMFVIDDTGSMSGEIQAVKTISKAIVGTQAGKKTVNYILSVFNDPTTGPLVLKESGKDFIKELEKLRAHGGGDGPELTFKGMLDAMGEGPREGSPMYVFTDATAKDHTPDNVNTLIESARDFGVNINFFATSSAGSFAPFVKVAKETCGMILYLAGSSEIKKLESITKLSLRNFACVSSGYAGGFSGKKRTVSSSKIILVDDSVKKMIISVSTQKRNPIVVLRNPSGNIFRGRKISLLRAAIYELINPTPGRWTLSVAASAGKYQYLVRGASDSNIDFDYYFVMVPKRSRGSIIPISQPLAGKRANVIMTVAGTDKVRKSTLSLEVIDSVNGRVLQTVAMTPRSRSNAHFLVSFVPPSTPFKFRMKGRTKAGNNFERSSRKTIRATTALIRVYKAKDGQLTIPRGGGRMYVILLIFNMGATETFDVSVNDPLVYAITRRKQSVRVNKNRTRRFILWFKAPSSAKPGKGYPVAVTIKGKTSRVEAGQILNLIIA